MKTSKTAAAVAAIALCAALIPNAFALTITQTHENVSQEPAAPAQTYTDEAGRNYTLSNYEVKELPGETVSVPFERWYETECTPDKLDSVLAGIPATIEIDEDGYQGSIPLVSKETRVVSATQSAQIDATQQYSGLPSNSVSQIPETIGYHTDWGNDITLTRAGVSFEVESTDAYGIPATYKATATFRGVDSKGVTDHYVVRAEYAGNVPAKNQPRTYKVTATYDEVVPEPAPAPTPTVPETTTMNGVTTVQLTTAPATTIPLIPITVLAAGATTGTALILFYVRRSRFRITQEVDEREHVVCRLPVSKDDDGIRVRIPADAPIDWSGTPVRGYAPQKWVRRKASMLLYVDGVHREGLPDSYELYHGPALTCIDLSAKELGELL